MEFTLNKASSKVFSSISASTSCRKTIMYWPVQHKFVMYLLLFSLCQARPEKENMFLERKQDSGKLEPRQLGPIGLTVLGALTLPILIPVGVARLVSRLTNLGNSSTSTGVTVRPVVLPSNSFFTSRFRNSNVKYKRKRSN